MTCTHCKSNLEEILTPQQLYHKQRSCKIGYTSNMFCSRSCSTSYNNIQKKVGKAKLGIRKQCASINCDNIIERQGRKFCVDCSMLRKKNINYKLNPTKEELMYSNRSSPYSYIRWHAREIVAKTWIKECTNCGYNKHVELAHIKSIASFTLDSKLEEINNSNNLLFLCPNCHWEYDNNRLTIQQIKRYPGEDSNLH